MAISTIVRPRADWIGILEAAYEPAADDRSWARDVLDASRRVFSRTDGIGMQVVEHDAECASGEVLVAVGTGPGGELLSVAHEGIGALGPAGFRAFFYPPAMVMTHSEIEPVLTGDARETMQRMRRSAGLADLLGIIVHPEPGVALVLSCALDRRTRPTAHERTLFGQIGLHLETAYRLRRRPDDVKAVLTLSGVATERSPDAPSAEVLAERARRVEQSLSKSSREPEEAALDLWPALLEGRYSLVRRRDEGGARRYLVLENKRHAQEIRALTPREVEVLAMAARGLSTKLVSYGLGLVPSQVSAALAGAASKLGLASRLELLRLAATLGRDPRAHALPETITAAESEVLALLGDGFSNDEIARLRSRSTRTVANQVASLLRKTGSATRRGLITVATSSAALGPSPPSRDGDGGRTSSEEEV